MQEVKECFYSLLDIFYVNINVLFDYYLYLCIQKGARLDCDSVARLCRLLPMGRKN